MTWLLQAMVRREVNLALATSGAGGDYQIELLTQFFCRNSSQLGCSSKSIFGKWGFSHILKDNGKTPIWISKKVEPGTLTFWPGKMGDIHLIGSNLHIRDACAPKFGLLWMVWSGGLEVTTTGRLQEEAEKQEGRWRTFHIFCHHLSTFCQHFLSFVIIYQDV